MINYRVRNLDAMLAQLRAAGAQLEDRIEEYDYGRFGWATDPDREIKASHFNYLLDAGFTPSQDK